MGNLTPEIIAELKSNLIAEAEQLNQELGNFAKKVGKNDYETKFDIIGDDEDENATEVEEYADNLALENTLEKRLREVNEALEKIEKGNYGFCENCQEQIEIERLKVYPAARACIHCSKK